jgi:hypothetical protein
LARIWHLASGIWHFVVPAVSAISLQHALLHTSMLD